MKKSLFLLVLVVITQWVYAQTICWQDSLSKAKVYLSIAEQDYKYHPHRTGRAFEVIESAPEFHETILRIANKSLRKYSNELLNNHVDRLYIYDQFDRGNDLMGLYRGRHGLLFAIPYLENGQIDTLDLERVIHHEISHRLLMFEGKYFDLKSWKQINRLNYGSIKSYNRDFDPELYDKGFLNKYGVMNKYEDMASFAENIFINKPIFWEAVLSHEALRKKFDIICDFYGALDPSLNQEFFLQLNGIVLAD